jgi:hypothetical protein
MSDGCGHRQYQLTTNSMKPPHVFHLNVRRFTIPTIATFLTTVATSTPLSSCATLKLHLKKMAGCLRTGDSGSVFLSRISERKFRKLCQQQLLQSPSKLGDMSNFEAQLLEVAFLLDKKGFCSLVSMLDKASADVIAEAVFLAKLHYVDFGDVDLQIFVYPY